MKRRLLGLGTGVPRANTRAPGTIPALGPLTAQIGPACLARRRIECRVCSEHCDPRAVRFHLAPGHPANPSIDQQACTGCGACVRACPAGAIAIEDISQEARLE